MADTETPPSMPSESEPAFLSRARRILGGDIRPEDYLPVTPEARSQMDLCIQKAIYYGDGNPLDPDEEHRQLRNELLSFHHAGQRIAYVEDEFGIVVLTIGLEQASSLMETFPDIIRGRVGFVVPADPATKFVRPAIQWSGTIQDAEK